MVCKKNKVSKNIKNIKKSNVLNRYYSNIGLIGLEPILRSLWVKSFNQLNYKQNYFNNQDDRTRTYNL